MSTCANDLNNVLNTIKMQFRYLEHMMSVSTCQDQINSFKNKLITIQQNLEQSLDIANNRDTDTIHDYYNIIQNIIDKYNV